MKTSSIWFIIILSIASISLSAQENCASALPIAIGGSISGDNTGANPDINYSGSTGCVSASYNSAHWYSFTTVMNSSVLLTFTAGTIIDPIITEVNDCSSPTSPTNFWYECDANGISGVAQTICDLRPNTTYYIQVSSAAGNEGTFTIEIQADLMAPPNDICEQAIVLFGGTLDCGEFEFPSGADAFTCSDTSSTNCFPTGTPGVWYTFQVPFDMPYGAFTINPVPAEFELYSSATGCNDLTYVDCGGGFLFFSPMPGFTYYILAISDLTIGAGWFIENATCSNPETVIDTGNGTGESDYENNSCEPSDPLMPCQNAHVIWYSYTVGCQAADLEIEVEPWDIAGPDGVANDAGIMAMLPDCSTIMSSYDMVNGTGFVCSALIGNEVLSLSNLPAGMTILIAVGSATTFSGYYEIVVNETPVAGGGLMNDICSDAITLNQGINTNLYNTCSSLDIPYPTCSAQSPATVWYEYNPTPNIEDITININSTGITNPAIAIYDDCSASLLLGEICGSSISLSCISGPIYIQIGSAASNTGSFDLEIIASTVIPPPPLNVVANNICSGSPANIQLSIPGGALGDIFVTVNGGSSSNITGMMDQSFLGVSSATINDILVNCATGVEDAIYTVEMTLTGSSCASLPLDIPISVFPKLIAPTLDLIECLPSDLSLNAADIVSGGTSPYQSYNWLWNGGVIDISDLLSDFPLTGSGVITLEVIDAEGCFIEATINVNAIPPLTTFVQIDSDSACPGNPATLNLQVVPLTGGPINSNSWTILDDQGNPVSIGVPLGDNYTILTEFVNPGSYSVVVNSDDSFACSAMSNTITFDIYPVVDGVIEVVTDANCLSELVVVFYGPNGLDIYNNGPDSNGDGIPDVLDIDNDGVLDVMNIIWTTPTMGSSSTNELSFDATESGNYSVEIITDQGCSITIMSDVTLPAYTPPSIIVNGENCLGNSLVLLSDPSSYINYTWLDANGMVLGLDVPSIIVSPTTSPSTYTLETVDVNGCNYSVTTVIDLDETPMIQLTGSTTICPGEITTINAGGDATEFNYEWFDEDDILLGSDSSSLVIDMPGMYTIIMTSGSSCADTLEFEIIQNATLSINISGEDLCGNVSTILDGGPGFDAYEWLNEAGTNLGNEETLEINTPGNYYLNVNLGMCSGMEMIEIFQSFPPVLEALDSITICNDSGDLSLIDFTALVSSSDAGNWVSLDLPSTTLDDLTVVDFDLVAMGDYAFVYTTNTATLACVDLSDTLIISVSDCPCLNLNVEEYLALCLGTLQFDLNDYLLSDTDLGIWSFGNGLEVLTVVGSTVDISMASSGNYEFVYSLDPLPNQGCPETDTLTLELFSPPEATFNTPASLCNISSTIAGSTLDLSTVLSSGSGVWIDPNITNLDFSDPNNLNFLGVTPGNYSIDFVTNDATVPCANETYSIEVVVIDCNCPIIDLQASGDLCRDDGFINLSLLEGISDDGLWSSDPTNPETVIITNGQADLSGLNTGTYNFIYTLDNPQTNCPETDTIKLELINPPEATFNMPGSLCNISSPISNNTLDLSTILLSGSGDWTDPNITNLDFNDPNNLNFIGVAPGNYSIDFTTNDATMPCGNETYSIEVVVIDCNCPMIDLQTPSNLCTDDGFIDLSLLQGISDAGSWSSDPSNPEVVIISNGQADLSGLSTGTYSFIYTLDNPQTDCPETENISLELFPEAVINSIENTDICNDSSLGETVVNLNIFIDADDGLWTDENGLLVSDPTSLDFSGLSIGDIFTYTYTTNTAQDPCEDVFENLIVTVVDCSCDDPVFLDPPILCNAPGELLDLGSLVLSGHQGTWNIIDQPAGGTAILSEDLFTVEFVIAGDYLIEYSLSENPGPNCDSEFVFTLTIVDQMVAEVEPSSDICTSNFNSDNTIINLNDYLIESAEDGYWLNEDGSPVDDPESINFLNLASGEYSYTYVIENELPCVRSESILIVTAEICSAEIVETNVYIPNVFSPNGDNVNDVFFVQSNLEDLMILEMYIFDRWGEKIFIESNFPVNQAQYGWNGLFKNQLVVPGVYQYLIEAINSEGEVFKYVGDISVVL